MLVIGSVFAVGAILLFVSQNRFQKPAFPDASAIQQVSRKSIHPLLIGRLIKLAIFNSSENFNLPDKAFWKGSAEIVDGEATMSIPATDLPEQFAIAAYHDENGDDQLNLNRIGIPAERYGFSRNARGLTGPPPFGDAVVESKKLPRVLHLSIR